MSVKQKSVTADKLWEMPNPLDKRFELIDGEVVEVSPAGGVHMRIVARLVNVLEGFVEQHDLGLVTGDGLGFILRRDPDLVRVPDVSFVPWEHVPDEGIPVRFWEGPPTLAVEVVSPDDRATEIRAKVQHYLEAGARLVWILWPDQQAVTIYASDGAVRELGPEEQLDGDDVLPGFVTRVGALFEIRHHR